MKSFRGDSDAVTSANFSPDGTQVVSASADKTVKLWRVNIPHPLIQRTCNWLVP
ncbi:WD40 repeat domain-containing protein [Sodalinema gerasimenkoae]|uniref:WD40 repeat domain-containing protein n=1 Tax=Sodalinema gerasimenkoae TaxID=2862348 RepID=UPI00135CEAF1